MVQSSLAGRVALVTGGGTGLGRAISLALAARGCHVAVNYARSREEAEQTVDAVRDYGVRAAAVRADVANEADVSDMVREITASLGEVEVLVNNAGTTRYVPFPQLEDVHTEDWQQILGVNLVGQFLCVQAVVPGMRERGYGKILNIASDSAFSHDGSSIPYVVSKAGVVSLTKCLARALGPTIQVNGLAPGWMATRWMKRYLPPEIQQKVLAPRSDQLPPAAVEDIARAGVDLLENDSISGTVLVVNRGESVG